MRRLPLYAPVEQTDASTGLEPTTALEIIGADARDRHQSLAALVLTGQRFNLAGEVRNARVQAAPVRRQVLKDAQHAGRERVGSRRKGGSSTQFDSL